MEAYTFSIILDREPTDEESDVMFEAHQGSFTFGVEHNLPYAVFDLETADKSGAVSIALEDLRISGLSPVRILDGDICSMTPDQIKNEGKNVA